MKKFIVLLLAITLVTGSVFAADGENLENQIDQLTKRIEYLESLLSQQEKNNQPAEPAKPANTVVIRRPVIEMPVFDYPDLRALERRINRAFRGHSFGSYYPDLWDFEDFSGWNFDFRNLYDYAESAIAAAEENAVKAEIDLSTVDLQQGDLLKLNTTWEKDNSSGKQSFAISINDVAKKTYEFTLSFGDVSATLEASVIRDNKVIASNSAVIDDLAKGSACKLIVNPAN